jgi:hypothetical protein
VFSLPTGIQKAFSTLLRKLPSVDAPLWLRFMTPAGLLPGVPWERLLQPLAPTPVLRLPYQLLVPTPRRQNLNCVFCFSSPTSIDQAATDELIFNFLLQIPTDQVENAVIHVFGDLNAQDQFREIERQLGSYYTIQIYEPPETTEHQHRKVLQPYAMRLENPWLLWMRDALGRRKVDVVHFIAHSFPMRGEEGGLALARSPARSDKRWEAGYVGAAELVEFLNQVGAWSVAFTAPPENQSMIGLRLLQDEMARLRPGPCLLHDMNNSQSSNALRDSYRFLFNTHWHPPAHSHHISIYCHPWHARQGRDFDHTSEQILEKYTLVGRIAQEQLDIEEHGWLTSAQRMLEQSASAIADETIDKDYATAGRRKALEFISDSLAKYAGVIKTEMTSCPGQMTKASEHPKIEGSLKEQSPPDTGRANKMEEDDA